MSGNPTVSNVVPMPHAAAPAQASAPMPMPSMWGGGGSLPWGPGCCPPGGMDALMKCYCDVQAATAFICSVMVQCVQTNPAVVQAIITAIENSGSSLPLLGVTNGSQAQPGQVGEFIQFSSVNTVNIPSGGSQVFNLPMGVLQPGDWEIQAYIAVQALVSLVSFGLAPEPAGFSSDCGGSLALSPLGEWQYVVGKPTQGLISVPTLLAFGITLDGQASTTGTMEFYVTARRAR